MRARNARENNIYDAVQSVVTAARAGRVCVNFAMLHILTMLIRCVYSTQ